MNVENKTNMPDDDLEQADRHARVTAQLAKSFRKILGPNFGRRIKLGTLEEPPHNESMPFRRIQEDSDR